MSCYTPPLAGGVSAFEGILHPPAVRHFFILNLEHTDTGRTATESSLGLKQMANCLSGQTNS